ncbi:FGGY-family carbohydrate kinase [Dongia sedimenti]|uniref:FGGY-family carbohydrate kinase n=1 Tax=Dongia sedimenti TaxID=3064282 RepID=A0ABU0YEW3_9PROT|nr:FGGY-family carbohydrate kinase [Rhodospirillaceae bacterium R-7]
MRGESGRAFIGVDVGTASARAGIFDPAGRLLATARHPIKVWHEPGDIVEQSSEDIWQACATAIRAAMAEAKLAPDAIAGIGFDATCSLVVLGDNDRPLTVSRSGDPQRNIIVWMDHRAVEQADRISKTGHPVLRHVGGIISPEMETPKILWLKEHLPATYAAARQYFDLADYLTWRASGDAARSICTVTCKWTYLAHGGGWHDGYFREVGLGELIADDHARIGNRIVEPATALGAGLTAEAAADLGLKPGTPVAASLIDAHAGAVGTIGGLVGNEPVDALDRLAYIMGTSACIMASTAEPRFVPGVWGPYFSAMLPGRWLNEGGQSAAGAGIDHLVRAHPGYAEAAVAAEQAGYGILEFLERRVLARSPSLSDAARLAKDYHVLPEFLGNRSPFADPDARAIMAGLDLERTIESLEALYVAGLCGLAYGLADVVDAMRAQGIQCGLMVISGGAAKSPLVRQIMADTTGLAVALPATPEPVLLGSAMLGAVAGGAYESIDAAMHAMSKLGEIAAPDAGLSGFHAAKRKVHHLLQVMDRESRAVMKAV